MVGIVSGLGLGVHNSSLVNGSAAAIKGHGNNQVFVNAANGNLILQRQDEYLL